MQQPAIKRCWQKSRFLQQQLLARLVLARVCHQHQLTGAASHHQTPKEQRKTSDCAVDNIPAMFNSLHAAADTLAGTPSYFSKTTAQSCFATAQQVLPMSCVQALHPSGINNGCKHVRKAQAAHALRRCHCSHHPQIKCLARQNARAPV